MINAIASFLGMIIRAIYNLVGCDYGLSIVLFTILTKLLLFPLNYKQAKSMEGVKKVAPLEKEIREKYKNNKEKQAEELSKMYGEHKVSPLGGCLPVLIQLPIIIAMFYIVKQPLTYIIQMPKEQIIECTQELLKKEDITDAELKTYEIQVARRNKLIDMEFLGFNLGDIPQDAFKKADSENNIYVDDVYAENSISEDNVAHKVSYWTLLMPLLSLVVGFAQTKITQKSSSLTEEQMQQQKTMNLMMPVLSAYISYIMPLALGVYWLFGGILGIISQIIINAMIHKNEKILLNKGGEQQ